MPEIRRCPVCKTSVVVTEQGTCPLGHTLDSDSQESQPPSSAFQQVAEPAPQPFAEAVAEPAPQPFAEAAAEPELPPPAPPVPAPQSSPGPVPSEAVPTLAEPAGGGGGGKRTALLVGVGAAIVLVAIVAGALALFLPRLTGDATDAQSASPEPAAASTATASPEQEEPQGAAQESTPQESEGVGGQLTEEQRLWALATCALANEVNDCSHDVLGGYEPTPENLQTVREGLSSAWGVNSREDLLETLDWIETEGHRYAFDDGVAGLAEMSDEEIATMREQIANNPDMTNQVDVMLEYGEQLGDKSIKGWDYSRYVALCGWGNLVGYLTEEEAWELITPVARELQSTFDSWEDLGDNYLIGRQFWSLQATQSSGDKWAAAEKKLLKDPDSPWVTIAWDMDLGGSAK